MGLSGYGLGEPFISVFRGAEGALAALPSALSHVQSK
jgi:hypothetical protein